MSIHVRSKRARAYSNSAVTTSRSTASECIDHRSAPVLDEVGNVADGVSVGKKVPASSAVAVVVEPRAEDQVGCDEQEETARRVSVGPAKRVGAR